MKTAKEVVREVLARVPDDASLEEIQYHIYVRQKIDRGLEDVQNGRTISQKEMESRMARWLGTYRGLKPPPQTSKRPGSTLPTTRSCMPRPSINKFKK
jgi:predicted transcriptional regulator